MVITKHQNQQAQARAQGFKNAWAMRKAKGQATYISSKHATKPQGAPHPWLQGSMEGSAERFDYTPGPVTQHVKDGRPLTETGARLLAKSGSSLT